MSRTAKRTSAHLRGDARERILAAARKLFAQHGFEGTSTKQIASVADVPSGLVFYYFSTKDELIEAIFDENHPDLARALATVKQSGQEEAIESVLSFLYDFLSENRYQSFILMAEVAAERPIAKRLRAMRERGLTALAEYFRTQSGGASTKVNPSTLAQAVASSIRFAVLVERPKDKAAYIEELANLVRAGLAPRAATKRPSTRSSPASK